MSPIVRVITNKALDAVLAAIILAMTVYIFMLKRKKKQKKTAKAKTAKKLKHRQEDKSRNQQ